MPTNPPTPADRLAAAERADWTQVTLTVMTRPGETEPCFSLREDGDFCLRANWWAGHGSDHAFVSLRALLAADPPGATVDRVCKCGAGEDDHAVGLCPQQYAHQPARLFTPTTALVSYTRALTAAEQAASTTEEA